MTSEWALQPSDNFKKYVSNQNFNSSTPVPTRVNCSPQTNIYSCARSDLDKNICQEQTL